MWTIGWCFSHRILSISTCYVHVAYHSIHSIGYTDEFWCGRAGSERLDNVGEGLVRLVALSLFVVCVEDFRVSGKSRLMSLYT